MNNHPFHLVDKSPWPIVGSTGLLTIILGIIIWFHSFNIQLLLLGFLIIALTIYQWWRDVVRESTFQGLHTSSVITRIKLGIILFITSEVLFFLSFFWAFFHRRLRPSIELGINWPPQGINSFNPINIPILNTIVLLSSGVTITWAHNSLICNNYTQTFQGLFLTIILGFYFTLLQLLEYIESPFCIRDSVYGSTFFLATGFHGLHVIIGTIFILVCFIRSRNLHFNSDHHLGFEASAWYWHFVDVVWLFLYISIYWWGK